MAAHAAHVQHAMLLPCRMLAAAHILITRCPAVQMDDVWQALNTSNTKLLEAPIKDTDGDATMADLVGSQG